MRLSARSDRWFLVGASAVLVSGGGLLGGLLEGAAGAFVAALLGALASLMLLRHLNRRSARRARLAESAFPRGWQVLLETRSSHFARLPPHLKHDFQVDVMIFMDEKRVTGVGLHASEELRLLVAASAITLSVAWPDFEWDAPTEVLLYPDDFDRDYNFGSDERAGETHPWGTVILSVPALLESFDDPGGGHVGYHEFAHLLDLSLGDFDGVPEGLPPQQREEWAELVPREMERMRSGRSVLDDYGARDPVEFFAVSVEAFFALPVPMRRSHLELYQILKAYFRQDPAEWEGASSAGAAPRRLRGR